ncbi:TauD/TfdA family dioxygenase [Streptomyces sp. NPDC088253]|uniref:TauD/TfdA family dioxygenase n=1 Tax=Streptomyces sp. NPDC088253 TaxID=3365846 RepID=UPI0037F58ED2
MGRQPAEQRPAAVGGDVARHDLTLTGQRRFGGGDPIGPDIVQLLNDTYTAHTAREPWQAGDLMLVDNVRTAHSREAFQGPREVLVAMAEPLRRAAYPSGEVSAV